MKRSYFYVLPVLLMMLVFGSTVFATEIEEEPFPLKVFLKYNTTQGSDPFLMAEISAELFQLDNEKNEKIMAEEIYAWTDAENETDKTAIEDSDWSNRGSWLSRVCLMPRESILTRYSHDEINTIHISMKLSKCIFDSDTDEKTVIETKTVYGCWQRPSANPDTVYDEPNSEANGNKMVFVKYPQKVYHVAGRNRSVQMQMTGTRGEPVELPSKIPVILGFCVNNSNNTVWLEEYAYPVSWKDSPSVSDNEKMVYQVESIDKPSDETDILQFYYKDRWYQLDVANQSFPEISGMDFPYSWMKCIISFVDSGYIPSILLLPDGSESSEAVAVEIDYKPTNASKIEVEVSTDGGTNWQHESDVDFEKYPIDAIPKLQGYSASILNHEQTVRLSEEGNGGFLVRLKIYGGPLGNAVNDGNHSYTVTEAANWPLNYEYVPPEDSSDDNQGSGGNKGNVGTDNSGSSEGIRPGTEQQPEDTSEPERIPAPEQTSKPEQIPAPEQISEPEQVPAPVQTSESERVPVPEQTLQQHFESTTQTVSDIFQNHPSEVQTETDTVALPTTEPEAKPEDESDHQKTIARAAVAVSGVLSVGVLTSVIVKKRIAVQLFKHLIRIFHR